MPWSEWITSAPYEVSNVARYRGATSSGVDNVGGPDAATAYDASREGLYNDPQTTLRGWQAAGGNSIISRIESGRDNTGSPDSPWLATMAQGQRIMWFDTSLLDLPDYREWTPPELDALTEGVDYTVRPDRTGTELDAFVEYEPGGNSTLAGWLAFASGHIDSIESSYAAEGGTAHGSARWLLLNPAPSLPVPVGDAETIASPTPLLYQPGDGTEIASIIDGVETPTLSVDFSDMVGTSPSFAVVITTDDTSDPVTVRLTVDGVTNGYTHNWRVVGGAGATALIQTPRWRYWIPGIAPLRQRQRSDGLGLSGTPRWRGGSSRQLSNRWRGYL